MSSQPLIVAVGLNGFFHDELADAKNTLGVRMSEALEMYVVNLLCDYCRFEPGASLPGDEPLALLYKRALEAESLDRITLLKQLGDVALYVSGFFADFIERSLVDVNYYVSMGGNAYGAVGDILSARARGEAVGQVFGELSQTFRPVSEVLTCIAERARGRTAGDGGLLRLYERYERTGSDHLRRLLYERGLVHQDPEGLH